MKIKFLAVYFFSIFFLMASARTSSVFNFALEGFKHHDQVGAVFECSSAVGEELMSSADKIVGSRRLIEIGAGMGSVTRVIVQHLREHDTLDAVEINPRYCAALREQFPAEKYPNVHIHCADILEYSAPAHDAIICTLPFNIFEPGLITRIQDKLKKLVRPGAYMSYVEYALFPRVRAFLTYDKRRLVQQRTRERLVADFKKKYLLKTVCVYKNLPPLYVHHLQF